MKPEEKSLAEGVSRRLRAIMAEWQMPDVETLAEACGARRAAASNWVNGYNLPPVWRMISLCTVTGLSLDYIYQGLGRGLDHSTIIRLKGFEDGFRNLPTLETARAEKVSGPADLLPRKAPKAASISARTARVKEAASAKKRHT